MCYSNLPSNINSKVILLITRITTILSYKNIVLQFKIILYKEGYKVVKNNIKIKI